MPQFSVQLFAYLGVLFVALPFAQAEEEVSPPEPAPAVGRELKLEEALTLAAQNNRDLKVARETLRSAHTDVERALAVLLPVARAQGKVSVNYPSVDVTLDETSMSSVTIVARGQLDGFLNVNIPIAAPQAYPALQGARLSFEAQKKQLEVTLADVLTSVATAFFAAAGNDEIVAARRHAISLAEKTLENSTVRLSAGVLSKVEVTRGQLALVQAEQRLVEAQDSRDASYRTLATLLRISAEDFRVQPPPEPSTPVESSEQLVDVALRQRPELLSLQLEARALGLRVRSSWLRYSPTLSLLGNLQFTNATGFSGQFFGYSAGLQLDWLLFDGLSRDADRHGFEAAQRSALYRMEKLRDTISDGVKNSRRAVLTKKQGLVSARRAVELAQETLELVRRQYEAGLATQLEVITAQDALMQAEVTVAQARFDLSLAAVNLRRQSGESLLPPS